MHGCLKIVASSEVHIVASSEEMSGNELFYEWFALF